MADVLRDTFDLSKGQTKVIFQQKKPLLNYELNLAQDILSTQIQNLQQLSVANSYLGDAFKVIPGPSLPNQIIVNQGLFYQLGANGSYPLYLSYDLTNVYSGTAPVSGTRSDWVYAEWSLVENDSFLEPSIGFATSREEDLNLTLNVQYGVDPDVGVTATVETITFNSSLKQISLAIGTFPNWMQLPGAVFTTNSVNNPGAPNFTVVSSADSQHLIIAETLISETLNNVRFIEFDTNLSGAALRIYTAYRPNILLLAQINRTAGVQMISDIDDFRDGVVYNFVNSGCAVNYVSPLVVQSASGAVTVGDTEFYIMATEPTLTLAPNQTNYIYIDQYGHSAVSNDGNGGEPTVAHLMLAEVRTNGTDVVSILDKRVYQPFSWSNKYGATDTGNTGFNSILLQFIANGSIPQYSCVYFSGDSTVSLASASTATTLPVTAIAPQTVSGGTTDNFVTFGEIDNPAWSWAPDDVIFASTAFGGLTNSAGVAAFPTGTYVQRVGVATSPTSILFKPDLIIVQLDSTAEVPLLKITPMGDIAVMDVADRISADRLSFLAPIITGSTSFEILPGRFFINDSDSFYFAGETIDMGVSGNYQTGAIPSGLTYNNAFFTIDLSGTVHMYQGISSVTYPLTSDPVTPANELPICVVNFSDNGAHLPGSISSLSQTNIVDKRNWLNLGNLDNTPLKPIFYDVTDILVQSGSMWINEQYYTLPSNTILPVSLVSVATHYVYLDITSFSAPGSGGNFENTLSSSNFIISTEDQSTDNNDKRVHIPLGHFGSIWDLIRLEYVIDPTSFVTYNAKFWKYRDTPYVIENGTSCIETFNVAVSTPSFTISEFQFLSTDYLDITINGLETYITDDWTMSPPNLVTFGYNVQPGAKVKISKV